MKHYPVVFFDLDHTLWDFDRNSEETLKELFALHGLQNRGVHDEKLFIENYRKFNKQLWNEYHIGKVNKEELRIKRFEQTFESFGFRDNYLEALFAEQYLERSPYKKHLLPGTEEVLEYLSAKCSLHVITNGFKEVQRIKISTSGLQKYFDHIHISEEVGSMKPDPQIFNHAVMKSGMSHVSCVMIGDNFETDILGAEGAGIDTIFFNPNREHQPGYTGIQIYGLLELIKIL